MNISYRSSNKMDETAISDLMADKKNVSHYVGGGSSALSALLVFNDGLVAERDGRVVGVLLFTPWYCMDGVRQTTEARMTFLLVRKDEVAIREQLLDIYHFSLRQNHYEISYADIEVSNCFAMEVFLQQGYRVSEDIPNAAGKRAGYRMYRNL